MARMSGEPFEEKMDTHTINQLSRAHAAEE